MDIFELISDKAKLAGGLRTAGYILASFGLFIIFFGTVGFWAGKLIGLSAAFNKPSGTIYLLGMLIIFGLSMCFFWAADRLEKKAVEKPD